MKQKRERGQISIWRTKSIANLYESNKRKRKGKKNKERKKKNIEMNGKTCFIDDNLVCEILSRLPCKSLMRFRSVCKHWLSLIQHDTHFHHSHFANAHSRSLSSNLVLLLPMLDFCGHQECFFSADLNQGRASVGIISSTTSLQYTAILNPVNGLICFLKNECSLCIYNPGTRERTPWIRSTLVMEDKNEFKYSTYGFGFDPTTKEHKVVCVWRKGESAPLFACEILTVGHNYWRRIDQVPPYALEKSGCVYVNGSIYWTSRSCYGDLYYKKDDPRVIIAFDVGSEKFRTISIPNFILNRGCKYRRHVGLLEMDGCAALFCRKDDHTVKLWMYHENISTSCANWSEETMELPFRWEANVEKFSFHGVAGTSQLILRLVKMEWLDGHLEWPFYLYTYNRENRSYKKVEISGISLITDPSVSLFTPFVESLFRLQRDDTRPLNLDLERVSMQELNGPRMLISHFSSSSQLKPTGVHQHRR